MSKKIAGIRDVRPQSRNVNKHSPRGMGALEQSIQQDGWIGAITVAADGETFDGSARIETAGATGFDSVEPIIVRSRGDRPIIHIREDIPTADDERAVRLGIAANRVAELNLTWDAPTLAELAQDLDLSGLFHPDEMAALLAEAQPEIVAGVDDDTTPAINPEQPTRVQPGDVWCVGPHLVACLDSTEPGNLDRVVKQRPKMIVADPPYGIDIVAADVTIGGGEKYDYPFGGVKKHPAASKRGIGTIGGDKPFGSRPVIGSDGADHVVKAGRYAPVIGDDSIDTAVSAVGLCLEMYPDAVHFWWGANNYAHVLPPSTCWIVWDKENTGNFADAELAWSNHPSAVRIFKHMWNGMLRASEHERRIHPTQKPVALFAWLYERYGKPGDVILDPFLGSGPSLKAAHRMGDRAVIGFELSPHYCDHILEWAEQNGLVCGRLSEG